MAVSSPSRRTRPRRSPRKADAAATTLLLGATLARMSDGVIVLDSARRVRYCNVRAGDLLGVDPLALVGKSDQEAFALIQQSLDSPRVVWGKWERALRAPSERSSFFFDAGPARAHDAIVEIFTLGEARGGSKGFGILLRDGSAAKQLALLEERERIAMSLHDGVIQSLYAIALGLGARERALGGEPGEVRTAFKQAIGQINAVIDEVREYIVGLRSHGVAGERLSSGIHALAEELRASTLVRPDLQLADDVDGLLSPEAATNVLYIAREATSNVIRHSGARAVAISLGVGGGRLLLTIRDDGQGFEPARTGRRAGDGLRNMAERARSIGGEIVVTSRPGEGTEVRLAVPLAAPAAGSSSAADQTGTAGRAPADVDVPVSPLAGEGEGGG